MKPVTVNSRRQITLSKELLQHLGVRPGDKSRFDKMQNGEVRIRADRIAGGLAGFFGSLKRDGQRPLTIDEMNVCIEQAPLALGQKRTRGT